MPKKGRYDPKENVTRHAAVNDAQCEEMGTRQNWELVRVERTNDSDLQADCVFDGDVSFPDSGMDLSQGKPDETEDE